MSVFIRISKSFSNCKNCFFNGRKKCFNLVFLLMLLLILNLSEHFGVNGCGGDVSGRKRRSSGFVSSASYYNPNWQQYFPQRKWPHYDEQIHGRPNRLRVGQGRYRMLPSGSAQLMCDFPDTMMYMVSNIIWERADLGHGNSLDDIYRDHGIQQDYVLLSRPRGSTLHLYEVTPLERGLYRCIASALDPTSGNTVTLFQDVHFYPLF